MRQSRNRTRGTLSKTAQFRKWAGTTVPCFHTRKSCRENPAIDTQAAPAQTIAGGRDSQDRMWNQCCVARELNEMLAKRKSVEPPACETRPTQMKWSAERWYSFGSIVLQTKSRHVDRKTVIKVSSANTELRATENNILLQPTRD